MKFTDLKSNQLFEIISYLDFKDLVFLQRVCKYFKYIQAKYKDLILQNLLIVIGLDPSPNCVQWNTLLKALHTNPLEKAFMPYYTDGGTFPSNCCQFIDKLIRNGGVYCTEKHNNVLVKYSYSNSINFSFYKNSDQCQIEKDIYYLPHIEEEADLHPELCPHIKQIMLCFPKPNYTCPARVLMCFSSIKQVEDLSLIHSFHSCMDAKVVIRMATDLNIQAQMIRHMELDIVQFEQSRSDIQLLCWVKYNKDAGINDEFNIKLHYPRFARYFYLLLIDYYRRGWDNNIDMGTVTPYASIVRIKET